jgi:hypothetical protein
MHQFKKGNALKCKPPKARLKYGLEYSQTTGQFKKFAKKILQINDE